MISSCDISTGIPISKASAPPLDPTGASRLVVQSQNSALHSTAEGSVVQLCLDDAALTWPDPNMFGPIFRLRRCFHGWNME